MSFLSPGFLIAFTLAVPLIAVYLLKVRPRRVPVTALFLWDRIFVEKKTSALFRRLRDILSLLLMIAALSLLVLGSARPHIDPPDSRDVLIVIDHSVSMSAHNGRGQPSSLELAKDEARAITAAIGSGRRAAIVSLSDRLDYRVAMTESPQLLRSAIASIQPTHLPSNPQALQTLGTAATLADTLRVILITDGIGDNYTIPEGVDVVFVGVNADENSESTTSSSASSSSASNIGFSAADLLITGKNSEMLLHFVLASSLPSEANIDVTLTHDDNVIKIMPVTAHPGINAPFVYRVHGPPGRYQLRLAHKGSNAPPDMLAADNLVQLVAHEPRPIRVGLETEHAFFFDQVIRSFEKTRRLYTFGRKHLRSHRA